MEEEKVYFKPGDLVLVKHKVGNQPTMWVIDKKTTIYQYSKGDSKESLFRGIICRWFDTNMQLHESDFNTKDLIKI